MTGPTRTRRGSSPPRARAARPFNGHNTDWIQLWLANETVPFPFSAEAVDQAAKNVVVLRANP